MMLVEMRRDACTLPRSRAVVFEMESKSLKTMRSDHISASRNHLWIRAAVFVFGCNKWKLKRSERASIDMEISAD
jgi:hypothetical protein